MDKRLWKLVLAALFAALTCVATMVIQIPVPLAGYLHFGDCFVLLSGWVLGPVWGALAAGIGSAMADLLTGYAIYAPATLVIKGAVALAAACLLTLLRRKPTALLVPCIISGVLAELIMVGGYFLYTWLVIGSSVAAVIATLPADAVQATSGVVGGTLLMMVQHRLGLTKLRM